MLEKNWYSPKGKQANRNPFVVHVFGIIVMRLPEAMKVLTTAKRLLTSLYYFLEGRKDSLDKEERAHDSRVFLKDR